MSDKKAFDASKALDEIKKDRNLTMVAGGAVAVIIGLFLPWYSLSFFGINTSYSPGLDGRGISLLLFSVGALAASLNVLNHNKKTARTVAVVLAVLAVLVMLRNYPDSDLGGAISTGAGYWLGLAGSVSMIAGTLIRFKESKKQ